MPNEDKNIVIFPNRGSTTEDPSIMFTGADGTTTASPIYLKVYPTSNGTLSFEGSTGQLFSITNDLGGSVFVVNDISGFPCLEILSNGDVILGELGGQVGVGITDPTEKLDVDGNVKATSFIGPLTGNAATATALATPRTINGTSFDGSANVTTSFWGTGRQISLGGTAKTVDGSTNVTWSAAELGIPSEASLDARDTANRNRANHTGTQAIATIDGLTTELSAASLLSKILTVDGSTSGLDADLLDGEQSSFYLSASNLSSGTLPAARLPALTGDVTSTAGSAATTLSNSGVTAGTYRSVTVDAKGRVTAGSNPAITADTLTTARLINGTSFDGSQNIVTNNWGAARTITIGGTGRVVNGSADLSWSLGDIGAADASHSHSSATTSVAGFMSAADKSKLDGIAAGAQVNVGTDLGVTGTGNTRTITSSTGSNVTIPVATTSLAGWMSTTDKTKLDTIEVGAEVNVATNLGYTAASSNGTVTSSTGTNATLPAATTSLAGLLTAADKVKLDGIEASADANVPTNLSITAGTTTGPTIVSSTGTNALFPTASASESGAVTTGNQTWSGTKTLASPVFTGTPTAPTATAGTNNTQLATTAFVSTALSNYSPPDPSLLRGTNNTLTLNSVGVTSGVNYVEVTNSISTGGPTISTAGSATNVSLNITTKGAGSLILDTGTGLGSIDIMPGASSLRLFDDDSSHHYQFLTGNRTANYTISLPPGNIAFGGPFTTQGTSSLTFTTAATVNATLPSGTTTLVPTTGTGATGTWGISVSGSAATLTTARTINGASFNGSANITTSLWGTARTLTLGSSGKSVDGSANVSWTLAEMGAAANTITISPGVGLTGGGNLTANRTLNVAFAANQAEVMTALNASGSAPIYAVRAWVNFNSTLTTGQIRASGNVSSITRHSAGQVTINFTTAMADTNYCAVGGVGVTSNVGFWQSSINFNGTYSTTSMRLATGYYNLPIAPTNGDGTSGNQYTEFTHVAIIR